MESYKLLRSSLCSIVTTPTVLVTAHEACSTVGWRVPKIRLAYSVPLEKNRLRRCNEGDKDLRITFQLAHDAAASVSRKRGESR